MTDYTSELLTVEQAAHYLQLTPQTVREHLKLGKIFGVKRGRQWRVPMRAIRDDVAYPEPNIQAEIRKQVEYEMLGGVGYLSPDSDTDELRAHLRRLSVVVDNLLKSARVRTVGTDETDMFLVPAAVVHLASVTAELVRRGAM